MTDWADNPITFGERVADLASLHPEQTAVIAVARDGSEAGLTWAELEDATNRAARVLERHGVRAGDTLVVALPNGLNHFVATIGAWKLGALVLPLDHASPPVERAAVLDRVRPKAVVLAEPDAADDRLLRASELHAPEVPAHPLPPPSMPPRSATITGGSTGSPKVVVRRQPWAFDPERVPLPGDSRWGFRIGQVQLVVHPIWHGGFSGAYNGLFLDHKLVVVDRFVPRQTVELIDRHGVNLVKLVPTMLTWIAQLPDLGRYNLSSLEAVLHGTAPCPPKTKRAWIELVGPERVLEGYGNQEQIGATMIRGDEWLERPGSVGRPTNCELRIRDADGRDLPAGTLGELFMRRFDGGRNEYAGDDRLRVAGDGFASVGDLAWVDDAGYVYMAGRVDDLIIVGGANVQPAEVEQVLVEHPAVADAAAIGVPDADFGQRVHAVVEPRHAELPPELAGLRAWCRERLAPYKAPRSFEFVEKLPRNKIGKVVRSKLQTERSVDAKVTD